MRYRRHKPKYRFFKWLIVAAVIIVGWQFYSSIRYNELISTAVDPEDDTPVSFVLAKDTTVKQLAQNLSEKHLIIDADAFKTYLKQNDLDRKIFAGRFMLSPNQTIPEIAASLTSVEKSQIVVTIPEGSTINNIDDILTEKDVIKAGEFIQATKNFKNYSKYSFLNAANNQKLIHPLEGYLFPDTYYIDGSAFQPDDLISMMLHNFENKTADLLSASNKHTTEEIIIMASLVEKEVKTTHTADVPKVAGILWKRNDENWMIGADAALLYLKAERSIDYKDLQQDSPYNLRNRTGLPPGPICNPGLTAIKAAINPESTKYYFYLTKPDSGEVVYAVTNDEHNANKARYLY